MDAQRTEILRDGFAADKFLGKDSDVPVFGLNLACAWPFPDAWHKPYEALANKLKTLGPEVYVYPPHATHITLVTFISFARNVQPMPEASAPLKALSADILDAVTPLFNARITDQIRAFELQPQPPRLARAAGYLPMLNRDGNVTLLRQRVVEALRANAPLHHELNTRGLNVPGIIHSTLLRFLRLPTDRGRFLAEFDAIAAETKFPPLKVTEVLLTLETKPYMRSGEVLRRFQLG